MNYIKIPFKEVFPIKKIVSIHYDEFDRSYAFYGEEHDFWEFVYVDKGEVQVMAGLQTYNLRHGEIIFHKPGEFHNIWANGKIAPNVIVIAFECRAEGMRFFENKILRIGDVEKNLLAVIIREARDAFLSRMNKSSQQRLFKNPDSQFGSEQIIKTSLEQLLIHMVRNENSIRREVRLSSSIREQAEDEELRNITGFLDENTGNPLTFDDVCRFANLNGTHLKTLFKERTGMGVMEYYRKLKTDEAKRMIREGGGNFTQIASRLGYASIHYFSRRFKAETGMTPTEYAVSVKAKI